MTLTKCIISVTLLVVFGHTAQSQNCTGLSSQWKPYFGDFCVWTSTEKVTWIDAVAMCREAKGGLVHISEESQNTRLAEIVHEAKGKRKYWIGLLKLGEDNFRWMMEGTSNFKNFESDMKLKEKENCAYIDKDGVWQPEKCTEELPFICGRLAGGLGF